MLPLRTPRRAKFPREPSYKNFTYKITSLNSNLSQKLLAQWHNNGNTPTPYMIINTVSSTSYTSSYAFHMTHLSTLLHEISAIHKTINNNKTPTIHRCNWKYAWTQIISLSGISYCGGWYISLIECINRLIDNTDRDSAAAAAILYRNTQYTPK